MPNPPNVTTREFPNQAVLLDSILTERTSAKVGAYEPTEPGAPFVLQGHSAKQAADFEDHIFLGQKAGEDEEFLFRYFGTHPATQDIANWSEAYSGESNAHPIFARDYLERRDSYAPLTKLAPFTGIYRINVTAAGTGFTSAPAITFSAGSATAIAILDNNGGIAKITIKNEGGPYAVAPTVIITGGGGAGATAVASIQPPACVLVKEDAKPAPFPYVSLYLLVTRIYETLPGPWITKTRIDVDGKVVEVNIRRNLTSAITSAEAISGGTTWVKTTREDVDDNVSNEIVETRDLPGNAMVEEKLLDEDGVKTTITRTMKAISSITEGEALSGGNTIWTKTESDSISALVAWEVVTSRLVPTAYTYGEVISFAFPTIYMGYYTHEGRAYPYFREGFSQMVAARVNVTYATTPYQPALTAGGYREARWSFPGGFNGVALTDEDSVSYTAGESTFSANLPPSFPTATVYLALVNATPPANELLIDAKNRRWKGALIWEITKWTINVR